MFCIFIEGRRKKVLWDFISQKKLELFHNISKITFLSPKNCSWNDRNKNYLRMDGTLKFWACPKLAFFCFSRSEKLFCIIITYGTLHILRRIQTHFFVIIKFICKIIVVDLIMISGTPLDFHSLQISRFVSAKKTVKVEKREREKKVTRFSRDLIFNFTSFLPPLHHHDESFLFPEQRWKRQKAKDSKACWIKIPSRLYYKLIEWKIF